MHVLIIPSWYVTPELPDSGIFFREKALALQTAGCRVGVLYVDLSPTDWKTKLQKGRWHQTRQYSDEGVATFRTDGLGLPLKWTLGRRKYLAEIRRLFEHYVAQNGLPDLIHAHSFWAGYAAIQLKRRYGIPFVYTEHLTLIQRGLMTPLYRRLVESTKTEAALTTAVSRALAESMGAGVQVVPNLVNTDFFIPAPTDDFRFLVVGDLIPRKSPRLIISAFQLSGLSEPTRLVFIGDGPLRSDLEKMAAGWPVEFRGRQVAADVRTALQSASCLILASDTETFGVVLIEAMSCGIPCIATRCGGPEDIITEETGILVEKDRPEALAQAMAQVYQQKNYFDRAIIRQSAITRFGHKKVAQQWISLYHNITGK